MFKSGSALLVAGSLLMTALPLVAHAGAPLTPERVFSDPDLSGPRASGVKLSPDGRFLTYLRPKPDNAVVQDLWAVPVKGGDPFLLLDASTLSSQDAELSEAEKSRRERMRVSARGVVSYDWTQDSRSILVPLDGDIYLVDPATKAVTRLTQTEADEIDAKLSPVGGALAYVRNQSLFVIDLASHAETRVTPQGGDTLTYGAAEFIAEEELDRHTGYWWSPKGDRIAWQRTDEAGVEIAERIEIGGEGTRIVRQRYPYAGKPNALLSLFVSNRDGSGVVEVDLGANSDFYLARVNWSSDGKALYVQRLSRDQKTLDLLRVDPTTGQAKVLLSESSQTWVELHDDFRLLKDGSFLWSSESDGNKHLYLYGVDGRLIRQVTTGAWPVDGVRGVDEASGTVYFEASKDTPIEHRLYRVSYRAPAEPEALTPAGGWWRTAMADNGAAFIGTYSDPTTPPQTALYDNKGRRLRWIEENALDADHPWAPYKDNYPETEFGTLTAADGKTDLHWRMLKPVGFDPSKTYPVIVSIYGGPAGKTVTRGWVSPADRLYQENGFIVFSLDNRGTPGRSADFVRAIYRQFGGPDIDDQVLGAKWLQSLPYVDGDHIGMMGWSQGGFVTLMALTVPDTPFAAGVAGAPPTQWGLYDTAYTERYMSTPQDNPDGYRASDVLERLQNLRPGSLLLMHGMADDNVLLSNSTRVMAALQKRSIPFEVMLWPGERHGVRGNEKNLLRYRLYLDFFTRKLKVTNAS